MSKRALEVATMPMENAVRAIRNGLPAQAFVGVANVLNLTVEQLAEILGASARTINDRRKKRRRLSTADSEKLVHVARVWHQAKRIFSSDGAAADWLKSPAQTLNGQRPIELLDTDIGARTIESILNGIAYGNVM
jgi:putative toxin-antitoxin system antitoxin component (TIGR02293 family)